MFNFTNGSNVTDDSWFELDGASFVTSADVSGTTYVFAAGAADDGISVFSLGLDGSLTHVSGSGLLNLVGVSGLTTITSDGNTYLVAAAASDNGLSVFLVSSGGGLRPVYDVADAGTLNLGGVSRVASATVSGNAYVFAAGTSDDGISVFQVRGDGKLSPVYDLSDSGTLELGGVKGMTTAVIGGNTFLFAAGGVDDGVSVFNIDANGTLINTANVTDTGTLKLDGASDVASAVIDGVNYLFVTGTTDNGVSVFSVDSSGILTNVDNIGDTADLRLAGATGVTVNTFGTTTYLTVGGTENGVSMFRVNAGGTLTAMANIDDDGSRELAGTTQLHTASVGGTSYIVAAGSTDDGISTFGLNPTGQLWFFGQGNVADARLAYINNDGSNETVILDNTPTVDLITSSPQEIGLDTAAGFYFAIINGGSLGDAGRLVRGSLSGGPLTVLDTYFGPDGLASMPAGTPDDEIVNTLHVDAINHIIYVGVQAGDGTTPGATGIKQYSYSPTTGAVTDLGFLVTMDSSNKAMESGYSIFDPMDFAVDSASGRLFFTESLSGLQANGLFRIDISDPDNIVQVVSQSQFPDDGSLGGYIIDVEVDQTTSLIYFSTESNAPYNSNDPGNANYVAGQNAIWYIDESAVNGTATQLTLTGLPGGNHFYPGDMVFDQNTRQLYVTSEENDNGSVADDDVIYVFQLDSAGTSASLVNTIIPDPAFGSSANFGGMAFSIIAELSGLNGISNSINEQQAAATTLLTGPPTITDIDGDHLSSATVQITGGKFSSNESSADGDHLGYGAAKQIAGMIAGTNITVSWNATTESLTLTGYDTIARYQSVLAAITYWTTGDNPTNYGLNFNRTITWTVSDGTPDVPGGSVNSGTTQISIAAVNDAPVNGTVSSAAGNEDNTIAITGLQINDADANPALQIVSVTLSVTKGVLTLLTDVTNGLSSGDISGNGTGSATISGTLNQINATLAATSGVVFTGNANANGTDTLTVVTNDNNSGGAGSGGAQFDTDFYTITINAVDDAPVVAGDGTETLSATNEDVADAAVTNTVSSLFSGQFSDVNDQVSGGSSANAMAGIAVITNGSSAGTGQWQYYDGSTWVNIGAASTAAAVTISATAPLRFLSAADYNGPAPTLTVKLVDASGGALTDGATVNVTASGGSTPYSTGTVVLDHTVTAVNDAPTIVAGSSVSLTPAAEDSAAGAGQTISSLFASHFSDIKDQVSGGSSANAFTGVAVTANAATATQGVYQYFSGGSWHDLPAVSASSAFVLDTSTLLRFVPAADYSYTAPPLIVSMIDDSSGAVTTGATADLTTVGGSTPYSAAMTLDVVVIPVNDAPIAIGSTTLASVLEDTAAPGSQTVSTLFGSNFGDVDLGDTLAGVAITSNPTTSQGIWQYFDGAWITIGMLTEGVSLVLTGGTLVRFVPAADFNGTVPALTAYLIDSSGGAVTTGTFLNVSVNGGQTRFSDTSIQLTSSITAVNDTPVVPASATTVSATEQTAAVLLGSLTITDVDRDGGNGDYSGASFTVKRASANAADTFAFASSGLFTVSGNNLQVRGLTFATFTDDGGVLTISFTSSGSAATTALVNDVINHITYINTSNAPPASVTLDYTFDDGAPGGGQGAGGSSEAGGSVLVTITGVNDIHTGGASITGTVAEDQVLTAGSAMIDTDGIGTLHYQWQHDVGGGFINVGADQSTYSLGDADVGGVVRVVIYYTDAGGTVESSTSAATEVIVGIDDAPEFVGLDNNPTYVEDSGRIILDPDAVITDIDHSGSYDGATLTLVRSTGADIDDSFGASSGSQLGDIIFEEGSVYVNDNYTWVPIGQVVNADGTLAITFNAAATENLVNAVLQQINYANSNDAPTGAVTIDYTFDNGALATGSITVNLTATNDAPDIENVTGSIQFTAGDAPQNIGSSVSITDADTATLASATVSISNFQSGDVLSADASGTSIQLTFTNGVLTLTGSDTLEHYRQVLATVTYQSTLADPTSNGTTLDRVISWALNDGQATSATETTLISFVPTLDSDMSGTGTGFATTFTENGLAIAIVDADIAITGGSNGLTSAQIVLTDALDGDSLQVGTLPSGISASIDTLTSGQITIVLSGAASAADYQQALQAISFQSTSDAPGSSRTIDISVGDGLSSSSVATTTISISAVNDDVTGSVSIDGTATEDQVLTANTSSIADVDGVGTLHYDWQRDTGSGFVSTGNADQSTYTLSDADVGGVVRVVISYTDGQGFAETATSAATAVIANVNDAPTGSIAISGTTTENQVLTADTSSIADADGLGTLHYQWQRDTGSGFVNVGSDQATYTLGDADVGGMIRVVTSYTDGQSTTETLTSAATAAIAGVNDPHTGGASITGTTTEDQVLTAVSTLADVDGLGTLHYDWQRDSGSGFVSIGAADQSTYTLGDADVDGLVRVVISYTDGQGFAETTTSAATAEIANVEDAPTGGVSISGTTAEYQVLTANTSSLVDADGLGTLHYQWQRDTGSGFVDVGSDQATYTLGSSDIDGVVRVVTSYTDGHGTAEVVTSAATVVIANVNDAPTGGVSISGTATENQVLTADTSSIADADGLGTLHYQWQRDTGSGFVNVGADQATYTLGDADVGGVVRVVTSYTDGQGTAEAITSAATAAIGGVNDPHSGGASISGTTTEDQVLTAVSTLADADGLGTLHYQWQRDSGSGYVNIGSDQATYTLGDADVGGLVRVVISYTDGQGFAETTTSAATAAIANVNDTPTGLSITGTATENQVLTADTSTLVDPDGLGTLHYQWQRDTGSGYVNVGTDQATYTLGDADIGGMIRVVTSYVDQQGTAEAITSAATAAIGGVNDPHSGGASISGTTTEDQVLTAVSTLTDADGLGMLHYDWQRDTGSGFVSTGAADLSTYTLGDSDVGGVVRVVISYTDGQGFAETATSAATAAIANVEDIPTGSISITGTATENQVLTADTSTLVDPDGLGTLHYQWQRDTGSGYVNVGNEQATYTLGDADVGGVVRVVTSYTDGQGTAETLTSAATATIANVNDAPVLAGDLAATIEEGGLYTLTAADIGYTDPDDSAAGIVFTVSGLANGTLRVAGKAATSFTAAELDAGRVKFLHDGSETLAASFDIRVEDGNEDNSVPVAQGFAFTVTPVNDAPSLDVTQTRTTIAEDASMEAARKVAVLDISDADGGDNRLSLAGADAGLFEIRNGSLWLKAGTRLDFEQNPDLDVTIRLKDPTLGSGFVDSRAITLAVTDVTESIDGTAGNDTLTGTSDKDSINGWGGNDTVMGWNNDDILMGNRGNDILKGGLGDDFLNGGAGNDTLAGGLGVDTLHGGGGKDVFVFGPLNSLSDKERDIVADFDHGVDRLDLSKFDSNTKLAGDQAFVWKADGNFSENTGDLIYRIFDPAGAAKDKTIVYGDVDHDGKADFQIELTGIVDLSKTDFIL